MGYLHIENLYKAQEILFFKNVFALEKIHGTSAHVAFKEGTLRFFAGGVPHDSFVAIFDSAGLLTGFQAAGADSVTVYGEAYGGKCQGMKHVYGPALKFVVFDVQIGGLWLAVPQAEAFAQALGLEFVAYDLVPTELTALDAHRALPSVQARRNGMGEHRREGDVLRPMVEVRKNNDERVIAKYKNEEFAETRTSRTIVDPAQLDVLAGAHAIADEWVTQMRLTHVIDAVTVALGRAPGIEDTGSVIRAMLADVKREAGAEVIWSREAQRAVGTATAHAFKPRMRGV